MRGHIWVSLRENKFVVRKERVILRNISRKKNSVKNEATRVWITARGFPWEKFRALEKHENIKQDCHCGLMTNILFLDVSQPCRDLLNIFSRCWEIIMRSHITFAHSASLRNWKLRVAHAAHYAFSAFNLVNPLVTPNEKLKLWYTARQSYIYIYIRYTFESTSRKVWNRVARNVTAIHYGIQFNNRSANKSLLLFH